MARPARPGTHRRADHGGAVILAVVMRLTGRATWWAPGPLRRFHESFGPGEGEPARPAGEAEPAREKVGAVPG